MTAVRAQEVARRVHRTAPVEATAPQYVGLVTRAIAFVVDAVIVNSIAAVTAASVALVLSLFPLGDTLNEVFSPTGGAVFFIWVAAYFAGFWTATGQTPGNRVMRIRVTRSSGERLRLGRALVRVVGVLLAALPLFAGFIPVLFTERRRSLADWMAGTVVVSDQD